MTGTLTVTAVVPVKSLAAAKSRLTLPAHQRQELALAFAQDTIASLCGSPLVADVLVVTSDPLVARWARGIGVNVTADRGSDLVSSLRGALRVAARRRPEAGVAVVPADLPCVRSDDVTQVLADARAAEGAFVPDRAQTGTTLVVYPPGREPVTCYGPGSAAGHRLLGLHALTDAPVRARHDVDTLADLREARLLGTGPATQALPRAMDAGPEQRAL